MRPKFLPRFVTVGCCGVFRVQVHEAWLDGKRYAVKVQRPGLKRLFAVDLNSIGALAGVLDRYDPKLDGASRWVNEDSVSLTFGWALSSCVRRAQQMDMLRSARFLCMYVCSMLKVVRLISSKWPVAQNFNLVTIRETLSYEVWRKICFVAPTAVAGGRLSTCMNGAPSKGRTDRQC